MIHDKCNEFESLQEQENNTSFKSHDSLAEELERIELGYSFEVEKRQEPWSERRHHHHHRKERHGVLEMLRQGDAS